MQYNIIIFRIYKYFREFVENVETFYFSRYLSQNPSFYQIIWKNMVKSDGPHMTIYYSEHICDLHVGYVELQTDMESV
jgi:hypothetical protein